MSLAPMTRRPAVWLALPLWGALALAALPSPAQAGYARAAIDWGGLQLTLEDTAPDDGVTPMVVPGLVNTWTVCEGGGTACADTSSSWASVDPPPAPFVMTGQEFFGHTRFASDRLEAAMAGQVWGSERIGLRAHADFFFFLTGPSRLTFSLPYTLVLSPSDASQGGSFAGANLLGVGVNTTTGGSFTLDSQGLTGQTTVHGLLTGQVLATENMWHAAFVMDAVAGLTQRIAAPVPEPGPALMLLAGLLAVGAAKRRRSPRA